MAESVTWFAQLLVEEGHSFANGDVVVVEINLANGYTYVRRPGISDVGAKHAFRTDIPMNDMLAVVEGVKRE